MYEDQKGYYRLAVEKKRKQVKPIFTFHYKVHAHGVLQKLIKDFMYSVIPTVPGIM
jgi:DNA polymerase-3 subunit epsilon